MTTRTVLCRIFPVLLILPWLTACGLRCQPVSLGMVLARSGGLEATSCGRRFELDGVEYPGSCGSKVRLELLGPVAGRSDEDHGYVARSIEGVAVARAIAVRDLYYDGFEEPSGDACSGWHLTTAEDVSDEERREIAKRATYWLGSPPQ